MPDELILLASLGTLLKPREKKFRMSLIAFFFFFQSKIFVHLLSVSAVLTPTLGFRLQRLEWEQVFSFQASRGLLLNRPTLRHTRYGPNLI